MTFVLDCSVTMAWVFPDEASEATDRLRESMIEGRAFVPALWPVEVGNVLLTATRRGRITADEWPGFARASKRCPSKSTPFPCLAYGEPRLRSHTSIGFPATMRRTSNWRCGCSSPWPRWIGRSAPLDGPEGWTCWRAPDLGGNGERMSRAIGRSVRVHRFGAKSGRSQQPRAMPPPVPMALTGGATDGGQGNRQAG